jgi:hypothetical protein
VTDYDHKHPDPTTPVGTKVHYDTVGMDLRGETTTPVDQDGDVTVMWEGEKNWVDTENVEDLIVAPDQSPIRPVIVHWRKPRP